MSGIWEHSHIILPPDTQWVSCYKIFIYLYLFDWVRVRCCVAPASWTRTGWWRSWITPCEEADEELYNETQPGEKKNHIDLHYQNTGLATKLVLNFFLHFQRRWRMLSKFSAGYNLAEILIRKQKKWELFDVVKNLYPVKYLYLHKCEDSMAEFSTLWLYCWDGLRGCTEPNVSGWNTLPVWRSVSRAQFHCPHCPSYTLSSHFYHIPLPCL